MAASLSVTGVWLVLELSLVDPAMGLPVLLQFPSSRHAVANTPAEHQAAYFARYTRYDSFPRIHCRVSFRIGNFGACSAFTTRYGLPGRRATFMALYTKGFHRFVTSTMAPVASGRSETCRVGFAPTGKLRLSTAHVNKFLTQCRFSGFHAVS